MHLWPVCAALSILGTAAFVLGINDPGDLHYMAVLGCLQIFRRVREAGGEVECENIWMINLDFLQVPNLTSAKYMYKRTETRWLCLS